MAVDGRKSAPTGHGCFSYHALACASVQRVSWAGIGKHETATRMQINIPFDRHRPDYDTFFSAIAGPLLWSLFVQNQGAFAGRRKLRNATLAPISSSASELTEAA